MDRDKEQGSRNNQESGMQGRPGGSQGGRDDLSGSSRVDDSAGDKGLGSSATKGGVAPGEVVGALEDVHPDDRLPAEIARVDQPALHVLGPAQRAGRRDQRDARAGGERRRDGERAGGGGAHVRAT